MRIWREKTPLQFIASCVWNISEDLNIPLGKYAPIIFGLMIGIKGKQKQKNNGN